MNSPTFEPRWTRRHGRPPFGPGAGGAPVPPPFAGPDDDEAPHHGRRGRRGPRRGDFGPPAHRGGPHFGPRRRGRARGDIRAAVLALVAEQPRHGYEIIQEIADRSGGVWRPSPGSVYPTLSQLQDEGLVRVEQTDGRRVVHLTEAGTGYVTERRAELDAVWASIGREADDDAGALVEQLGQLYAAAQQVMGAGTPDQITAATAALTEARKTIYRLLAE